MDYFVNHFFVKAADFFRTITVLLKVRRFVPLGKTASSLVDSPGSLLSSSHLCNKSLVTIFPTDVTLHSCCSYNVSRLSSIR